MFFDFVNEKVKFMEIGVLLDGDGKLMFIFFFLEVNFKIGGDF